MLIRYGRMNILGLFEHNETEVPRTPTRVVVKTDKGLELGHLVGQLSHYKDGRFRLSEEQVASYYVTSEIQFNTEPVGKVVRFATADDISEEQHLQAITAEEIESCERIAEELGLRMKIIDAEHIFGGERIVFYFMAEGRVDFRELVRKLAQEYQTRIEMRQIGSRDEAKLLGDVESCGRECCCLQFLQLLKPVNMRMAKMQKATLDPSKISGLLRPAEVLPAVRGPDLHGAQAEPAEEGRARPDGKGRGQGDRRPDPDPACRRGVRERRQGILSGRRGHRPAGLGREEEAAAAGRGAGRRQPARGRLRCAARP